MACSLRSLRRDLGQGPVPSVNSASCSPCATPHLAPASCRPQRPRGQAVARLQGPRERHFPGAGSVAGIPLAPPSPYALPLHLCNNHSESQTLLPPPGCHPVPAHLLTTAPHPGSPFPLMQELLAVLRLSLQPLLKAAARGSVLTSQTMSLLCSTLSSGSRVTRSQSTPFVMAPHAPSPHNCSLRPRLALLQPNWLSGRPRNTPECSCLRAFALPFWLPGVPRGWLSHLPKLHPNGQTTLCPL